MAVEDKVMEGSVSSLLLDSLESNEKVVLSEEDIAWADSCLIKDSEISDGNWNSLKDALLEIIGSQPTSVNSSASLSDGSSQKEVIEMLTTSDGSKANLFLEMETETETLPGSTLNDLIPYNEEAQSSYSITTEPEDAEDLGSVGFVGNPFLPTYNDDVKETETVELGPDLSSSMYEIEPTTDDIFRVWDLDVPTEEDEFLKQLKKAFAQSSLKSKSSAFDDSDAWKDVVEDSLDNLIAGIADLSLNQHPS
ncbi:hypothetical protein UlMin_032869 [Ulmus minor]